MDPDRTVNVSVQVLPLVREPYPVVDRAIRTIRDSGVMYEVGPMETTMEGTLDRLLEVARAAHLSCFDAGADKVVTIIKIADAVEGTTIAEKTAPHRRAAGGD